MLRLFMSYSHRDREFRDRLAGHLSLLKRQGLIDLWSDCSISPGQPWRAQIESQLEQVDIILLLVSSAFLTSDFCWSVEVKKAMDRHKRGLTRVIPIIVRPCDWHSAPFGSLQALPQHGKPVSTCRNQDIVLSEIAKVIRRIAEESGTSPRKSGESTGIESLTFEHITIPKRDSIGIVHASQPSHYPFDISCVKYFEFKCVDPILDVTVMNPLMEPVLITKAGVEIVSVAQTWWVGAKVEPLFVKPSEHLEIMMPDVWEILSSRGVPVDFRENISPQSIRELTTEEFPDPVYLTARKPFRYTITFAKYIHRVPDYSIVRLLVYTNKGVSVSGHIYIHVPANKLHAFAGPGERSIVIAKGLRKSQCCEEADALLDKATAFFKQSKYTEAEPLLKDAIEMKESILGKNDIDVVHMKHNLGVLCYYEGRFSEAASIYEFTLPLIEKHYGPNDPEVAKFMKDVELLREIQKNDKMAEPVVTLPDGTQVMNQLFYKKMLELEEMGQFDKAAIMATQLYKSVAASYGLQNKKTAHFINHLGVIYWKKADFEKARVHFKQTLDIRMQCLDEDDPDIANSQNNLASTLRELGSYQESEELYQSAIRILENSGDKYKGELAMTLGFYAKLLDKTGRRTKAEEIRKRARSIQGG